MSSTNNTECYFWPKYPSRCRTIKILQYLFASISLICLLFVIVSILLFKLYKLFVQRLILSLCISAAIKVIMMYIHIDNIGHNACVFQGFVTQFFGWAELLWVCVITINIMMMVVYGYHIDRYEERFHLLVWGVSLFWSIVPLFGRYYGLAGSWCWIKREYTAVRFGTWYIPFMIIIVIMIFCYIYLLCYSNNKGFDEIDGTNFEMEQNRIRRRNEVTPLLAYPIIFLILSLPLLIYRIQDATNPGNPPVYILLILSVIASPLTGTFNALAFAAVNDTLKNSCTLISIKSALLSCCFVSSSNVTHNYQVIDEDAEESKVNFSPTDEADTGYGSSANHA